MWCTHCGMIFYLCSLGAGKLWNTKKQAGMDVKFTRKQATLEAFVFFRRLVDNYNDDWQKGTTCRSSYKHKIFLSMTEWTRNIEHDKANGPKRRISFFIWSVYLYLPHQRIPWGYFKCLAVLSISNLVGNNKQRNRWRRFKPAWIHEEFSLIRIFRGGLVTNTPGKENTR